MLIRAPTFRELNDWLAARMSSRVVTNVGFRSPSERHHSEWRVADGAYFSMSTNDSLVLRPPHAPPVVGVRDVLTDSSGHRLGIGEPIVLEAHVTVRREHWDNNLLEFHVTLSGHAVQDATAHDKCHSWFRLGPAPGGGAQLKVHKMDDRMRERHGGHICGDRGRGRVPALAAGYMHLRALHTGAWFSDVVARATLFYAERDSVAASARRMDGFERRVAAAAAADVAASRRPAASSKPAARRPSLRRARSAAAEANASPQPRPSSSRHAETEGRQGARNANAGLVGPAGPTSGSRRSRGAAAHTPHASARSTGAKPRSGR